MKTCTVDLCDHAAVAQKRGGLCEMHQQRLRRTGSLEDKRGSLAIDRGLWKSDDLPESKSCYQCKIDKPLDKFWKNRNGVYGRDNLCADCRNGSLDAKDRNLRKCFKMTRVEYEAKALSQNNQCAICHTVAPLVVDHDHRCCPTKGKSCGRCVRSLICSPCNLALGSFKDNPAFIESAINYLASWKPSEDYYRESLDKADLCMVCCLSKQDNKKALAKDHAHLSCCGNVKMCANCFRGILCNNCNFALGNFKDNIQTLKSAITYLNDWNDYEETSNS